MTGSDRRPLGERLLKATPLILAIGLATLAMEHLGWLDQFETAGIDTVLRLQMPRGSDHVTAVAINDDDYARIFNRRSPLSYQRLQDLIDVVARGGASMIAVDIDTSDPSFAKLTRRQTWPPIIWGVDAIEDSYKHELTLFPALGGSRIEHPDGTGVALVPEDSDAVVRHYSRLLPFEQGSQPSFAWATVRQYCRIIPSHCPNGFAAIDATTELILLNFTGERYDRLPISAGTVLGDDTKAWAITRPFADRIVVIGGVYHERRDVVVTPLGEMPGVVLMAQVMESEIKGNIRSFPDLLAFLLDVIVGYLIVVIHSLFSLRLAVMISVVAVPTLSLLASFVAFTTFSHWFNFAPMIVGVLIHELYDHALEYRRLLEVRERASSTITTAQNLAIDMESGPDSRR